MKIQKAIQPLNDPLTISTFKSAGKNDDKSDVPELFVTYEYVSSKNDAQGALDNNSYSLHPEYCSTPWQLLDNT